ncbi:general secretion pathway protein [Sulfurifustis variabilis]|uniref:General secretion pathway protein n=1 Tax=Sulfurifustis variabilis TaxID=1675686 RepID=A0A1B4V3X2_9GAMM|nr:AAA family ATPase [Sulfurifustis variabilis]BAU48075.1 general secretion pathway protein [Sulfurifustis variabilis]
MYESYYGFREKPFSLLPDPAFLYMSDKHRMALTMLQYGLMNQAGFTVITGEIGSGKTTLIRRLLEEVDDWTTIGLVSNTHRNFGELLQWVLLAFGLEFREKKKVELYATLADFIVKEYSQDRRTVLIIDEAQNLSPEALEELRMLSNVNADKDQVLQLVLVGQPGLRDMLRRPELYQFAQRIAVDYNLRTLNLEETWGYVRHRLRVAGGDQNLFDTRACAAVYYYTRGTPRLINVLCDTALVYGFAEQKNRIDADIVCEVVREKTRGGIFTIRENRAEGEEDERPDRERGAAQMDSKDM